MDHDREEGIRARGLEIFRLMESGNPVLFDRKKWSGMLMDLAMTDPDLKVRLFRFVDVLPTLGTPELIVSHIREYFLEEGSHLPQLMRRLLAGIETGLASGIAARLIKRNIISFSRIFIAGETPAAAVPILKKLWRQGSEVTVDILGEAALSEKEAGEYLALYVALISFLAGEMAGWPLRLADREKDFPRLNISVKASSLFARIGPLNYEESVAQVKERLRPVFRAARLAGGFINLDMEMYSLKNITLDVFMELMDEKEFRDWSGAGLALQAYLQETRDDLQRLIDWARRGNRRITIRLVKGAYWEYETVTARQKRWPVPVFAKKAHTDWNFEQCADLMLANSGNILSAFATHNVRTIAAAMIAARHHEAGEHSFEFQMLYGMAEPVKEAVRRLGYIVREYSPIGELLPGMAYLVRRLLENTSNEGFLRRTFADDVSHDTLLAPPVPFAGEPASVEASHPERFNNEPLLDFSMKSVRAGCRVAIERVRGEFGRHYPAVIGGVEYPGNDRLVSINPASPLDVVGSVAAVSREEVLTALTAARGAQPGWALKSPAARAGHLFRAAEITRLRRMELMAWQMFETGKNWGEADADVAEAIDFLEYYGREMLRIGMPRKMGDLPGEDNRYFYQPRGVALVVAPWNFPLAISMGMVSAALVAGNTVLYKPSSKSVVNGWQLYAIFREAGIPDGVLNFIPGRGDLVGEVLATHRDIDVIAFTGSREVGLKLIEQAARTTPGQRSVKRVIVEMGGKNGVIVDSDADLDQAVSGVLQSAFGYQGQKCSACSRVIVLSECYDRFLERLVEAVKGITVGPPEDPACLMGPLIDGKARAKVEKYIVMAREQGRIAAQGTAPDNGFYLPPTIVTDLPSGSPLLREEIFCPVLAVIRAGTMDEALRIANESDYALTGGLYSRSPASILRASREFAVGNLYINRGITGANVNRQPFGGFRLSGIGSKAGGPDYLLQFLEPRVVTENTMRRGFSPDMMS